MVDTSESIETWLQESQNTEFDQKAADIIHHLGENKQRFDLRDPFYSKWYQEGVGELVGRLIYVQKMAILPDTLPKEWTEKPKDKERHEGELMVWTAKQGMVPIDEILDWAESMKTPQPLGIEDEERNGVISAVVDTLTEAGLGEDIQKLKEATEAFVQKQQRFEIRNEFFFLHRPAIKENERFKSAVLFALKEYRVSYYYFLVGGFHSSGEGDKRRVVYWRERADTLKKFLKEAHFGEELGAIEVLMNKKFNREFFGKST